MKTTKCSGSVRIGILFVALVMVVAGPVFAQVNPFSPANPLTMGRGGAYTADATGYNAFFYNPAGFAGQPEFTLVTVNSWAFVDRLVFDALLFLAGGGTPEALPQFLMDRNNPTANDATARSITARQTSGDLIPAEFAGLLSDDLVDYAEWIADLDQATLTAVLESEEVVAQLTAIVEETGLTAADLEDFENLDIGALVTAISTIDTAALTALVEEVNTVVATTTPSAPPPPVSAAEVGAAFESTMDFLPSGNMRVGAHVGIGWTGGGLGLGVFANAEGYLRGRSILSATGRVYNTISIIGGLGLRFGDFAIGASVRPSFVGYTDLSASALASGLMGGALDINQLFGGIYHGIHVGVDLGVLWDIGPLTLGATIKDIVTTRINYRVSTLDQYVDAFSSVTLPGGSALPVGTDLTTLWQIPFFKLNMGVNFHPDFGDFANVFDFKMGADLSDVLAFARDWRREYIAPGPDTFAHYAENVMLRNLHLGAEIDLLRLITASVGFDGGWITAGVGVDLLFIEINAGVAANNLQIVSGQIPQFTEIAAAVEVALRF